MAIKSRGDNHSEASISCGTCGESFPRSGIYIHGVAHCNGDSAAFGAKMRGDIHHTSRLHPRCWRCHAPLGCFTCSGSHLDLLCHRPHDGIGPVWATFEALLEHGLLQGQISDIYPFDWVRRYVAGMAGKLV